MKRCSAGVLQEAGVGAEFEEVETKVGNIRDIVKSIEAMACEAMAAQDIILA